MKKIMLFLAALAICGALIIFYGCNSADDEGSKDLQSRTDRGSSGDDDDNDVTDDDDNDDSTDDDDNDDLEDGGVPDDDDDNNDDDSDAGGLPADRVKPDAGQPTCDHDPKDCDHQPACSSDDDCSCGFACREGKCLSQHCYCAEKRGEDPCGQEMQCDENSAYGFCVKATDPCKTDSDCQHKGENWACKDGKCKRKDTSCNPADTDACSDYKPAIYTCVNGMCVGNGAHGDPCPNYSNFDCAAGHICESKICKQSCSSVGQECPPPAGGRCVQQQIMGMPVGEAYCDG